MGRKKKGTCGYCGKTAPITRDHIPPKNLFPRPRPRNLITVPCCSQCHISYSKDDEYFRAVVLGSELTQSHMDAASATEAFLRSLKRPDHRKFLQMLHSSITLVDVYTRAGIYLDRRPLMHYDRARMDRVISRIVKGLFYYRTGRVFPDTHEIITAMPQNISAELDNLVRKMKGAFSPPVSVGNEVFQYAVAFVPEDRVSSCWVMFFYDRFPILAFVRPIHDSTSNSS